MGGSEHPDLPSGGSQDQKFLKNKREISSAGSEHLPYKQGVTGSNPVSPTKPRQKPGFFYIWKTTSTYYFLKSWINIILAIHQICRNDWADTIQIIKDSQEKQMIGLLFIQKHILPKNWLMPENGRLRTGKVKLDYKS